MIQEYLESKCGFKMLTACSTGVKSELGLPMYGTLNIVEQLKKPRKNSISKKVETIKDILIKLKIQN